jgi:hypothetical protein
MKKKIDNPTPLDILGMFLPSGLLDYFDLINSESLETCFILFLEEKNIIPEECKTLTLHAKGL